MKLGYIPGPPGNRNSNQMKSVHGEEPHPTRGDLVRQAEHGGSRGVNPKQKSLWKLQKKLYLQLKVLILPRSGWPLHYEVANDTWREVATPTSRSLIQRAGQPCTHFSFLWETEIMIK